MQTVERFVLSLVVALLAGFVVGGGACASGLLLDTGNHPLIDNKLVDAIMSILFFGAIPAGIITFVVVMIKMWDVLSPKDDQQSEFKLPPKATDQPPPDSKA